MPPSPSLFFTLHCFGASLTEGLTFLPCGRQAFTPFTDFLPEFLPPFVPVNKSTIKNYGACGEETSDIKERFDLFKNDHKRILTERSSREIFVFLAGTNDLGSGRSVDEAFQNMYAMIVDCLHNGNKVVVCSIPSTKTVSGGAKDTLGRKRTEYNAKLETLCKELGEDAIQFFDLFKTTGVVVSGPGSEVEDESYVKLNPDLAADNIHLNPQGYRMLAEGIAQCLTKFFAVPRTAATAMMTTMNTESKI